MGTKGGPPAKKAAGTAVNPVNGQRAILTERGERFRRPNGITHPQAVKAWDAYWEDPVSSIVTEADKPMLIRWITMVNRYWSLIEQADEQPLVRSKANGEVANPLYRVCLAMENQIQRLEVQLGIGPKSRGLLGIQVINQERGKRELERDYSTPALSTPEDEEDPRL